jgi:protein-disulfide isomerase
VAEREQRRQAAQGTPRPPIRISPIAWITGAAIVVGVLVIVVAALAAGAGSGGSSTSLKKPPELAPLALLDGRSIGPADAPVQMELWEDLQCSGCMAFTQSVEPRLVNQYVVPGKLRITFHDFAFIGQESLDAATAARCAGEQGKFWYYQQYVYENWNGENQGTYTRAFLDAIARELGLDMTAFDACLADGKELQAVRAETAQGEAVPVTATPTIIVNGQKVGSLSFSDIAKAIDEALAAASGTAAPGSSVASPGATPPPGTTPLPGTTPPPSPSPAAAGSAAASASPGP